MAKNWTKIQEKYKGRWVALADDEKTVLGSGHTLKKALAEAGKKGNKNPIVTRMPEKITSYVGRYEIQL